MDEIPELSFHYEGFVNDENASVLDQEPTISTTANDASPAGVYDVNATGGIDANYHFTYHGSVLEVGEGAQHLDSFDLALEAVYGDEPLQAEATATSGLAVSFSSSNPDVLEVNGTQLKIRGAGSATITAHQDGDANFFGAPDLNATVTVHTAELQVIAHPASKAYLDEIPELSFHYEGFVNDENASVLDQEPTISTTANDASPAGVYDVNATGGIDANYHFTYHGSVLEVGEGAQHLDSFDLALEAVYGDEPLQAEATATSGLAVSFSSSNPDVLEVNGDQLEIRGAGEATITAHQDGDANFFGAPDLNATVVVHEADLQVIAHPASKAYLDEIPELTFHYEGFVNDENASVLDQEPTIFTVATEASPAGTYDVNATGGFDANYHFTYHGSELEIGEGAQHIDSFDLALDA
ncbi:uncharacterized protein METZ01_LOCUS201253, partial [marine metagenome]